MRMQLILNRFIPLIALCVVVCSCESNVGKESNTDYKSKSLFTLLNSADTGIDFINEIIERYAGASSAIADHYYDDLCDSQLTIDEISELVELME